MNDDEAPVITTNDDITLWPPNHKYETIKVSRSGCERPAIIVTRL